MERPTVTHAGLTLQHNAVAWQVKTNRHTNTNGTEWGWIEGPTGNICWSNNKPFNRAAAGEITRLHNEWLEAQKPLSIRLIEASESLDRITERLNKARAEADRLESDYGAALDVVRLLESESQKAA